MDRALSDEALSRAQDEIEAKLLGSVGAAGCPHAKEAAAEAVPVLEALLSAGAPGRNETDRHEALALAALLGRRCATLGLSPTATLALCRALASSAAERGGAPALDAPLVECALEGHVAGEVERVRAEVDARGASCVRAFPIAERALSVAIFASVGPDALEEALDGVARKVLETDADTCLAIVTGAPLERDERAFVSALASLGAGAMMVGARIVYVIEDAGLRTAATASLAGASIVPTLAAALEEAGLGVTRTRSTLDRVKGLFKKR